MLGSISMRLGKDRFQHGSEISYRPYLDWIVCGAETGPGKRPMDLDWARSIRDQCQQTGTPFFFKKSSDGGHELDGKVWEGMA